eukprot:TRINITY_DN700_c0_g1_i1.p1 TRINITY_DN700_c0_g1~~TRINITY_DN700_c0_g1_i1.p1  ORF type:complete len:326 (-),score=26.66 TRINITY_DN700_c0_g1_i1:34-1011(-)
MTKNRFGCILITVIMIMIMISGTIGSKGDRTTYFKKCLTACRNSTCNNPDAVVQYYENREFWINAMFWSCEDDCRYLCMRNLTEFRASLGKTEIYKFYGKWPFKRILGTEEIASCLFSLGNFIVSSFYCVQYIKEVPSSYDLKDMWSFHFVIVCLSWVFSTIFHAREYVLTEHLDYYFAAANIFSGSVVGVINSLEISSTLAQYVVVGFFATWYFRHIYFLEFVKFDYGYNVKVLVVQSIIVTLSWFAWSYRYRNKYQHAKKISVALGLIVLAGALEVFDFAPIFGIFDAHSIWHLLTIPLYHVYFTFAITDGKRHRYTKKDHDK